MTNACDLMSSIEYFDSTGGVASAAITQAEQSLDLRFAYDYREYLTRFGTASYYGHELTGLGGPARVDVVRITREQRGLNPDVPSCLYVIEELHIDGVVYWQDAAGAVYESQPNSKAVKTYDSLEEYVKSDM